MNIVLDNIIFSLQRVGGVSVYWQELLRRMLRDGLPVRTIELPGATSNIFRKDLGLNLAMTIKERALWLKLSSYLPFAPIGGRDSLYHSSYYRQPGQRGLCSIITVHDFTYEKFRKGPARWTHALQKRAAVRSASGVICVSESTKRDLVSFFPEIPESKITVIHQAASGVYRLLPQKEKPVRPSGLPDDPFILFVGARHPYKNFETALLTLAELPGYSLVSAGGGPLSRREESLSRQMLPRRHVHFPAVNNETMNRFYNGARALLYPSSYEGFGIPVLEAMAAGCPVVAVNSSSIPEAAGDAGLLVDKLCPEEFARQILRLEAEPFRSDVIRRGLKHAAKFSWELCYQQTMAFYKEVWSKYEVPRQ